MSVRGETGVGKGLRQSNLFSIPNTWLSFLDDLRNAPSSYGRNCESILTLEPILADLYGPGIAKVAHELGCCGNQLQSCGLGLLLHSALQTWLPTFRLHGQLFL